MIIVNENDEVIGSMNRKDDDGKNICRVAALWIENSKGEVLLAQRSFNKTFDPGKWGPAVAGTVEVGETYESNIIKEAEEEIGLNLKDYKFEKLQKVKVNEPHNYFGQWYKAIVDKDLAEFRIDPIEVEQIRWFSPEELRNEIENEPDKFTITTANFAKLQLQG